MPVRRAAIALAIAALALPLAAEAAWPDKPVRVVVNLAAGGASNVVADPVIKAADPEPWT